MPIKLQAFQKSLQKSSNDETEVDKPEKRYTSPEKRQEIIDELRLA